MAQLDLDTARALVEAGYMPLSVYLEMLDPGRNSPLVPVNVDDPGEMDSIFSPLTLTKS